MRYSVGRYARGGTAALLPAPARKRSCLLYTSLRLALGQRGGSLTALRQATDGLRRHSTRAAMAAGTAIRLLGLLGLGLLRLSRGRLSRGCLPFGLGRDAGSLFCSCLLYTSLQKAPGEKPHDKTAEEAAE